MPSVAYFSEGIGLLWMTMGMLALLVILGLLVRFSPMRPYLGHILVNAAMIVLSGALFFLSFDFPADEAGAAVMPRLYAVLIVALAGVVLVQVLRGKEKATPPIRRKGLLALVVAIVIGYFLALPYLGYFLDTFILVVVLLHLLSYPRKGLIYGIAAGWVLFSYAVFYKLMYIQLPLGLFENLF